MPRATTTERSRPMKRTRNGILIPDVPIMAGGNLPNAVKGVSAGVVNKHIVDLGLPSGIRWGISNLDLNNEHKLAESPYSYNASYFSWANIDGYAPVNNSFENVHNWGNINSAAPWYDGQPYGDSTGVTANSDISGNAQYDAATAILGNAWRMPTRYDCEELIAHCIFVDADGVEITARDKRTTINGVVGLNLQSMENGKRLFFAVLGLGQREALNYLGINGYYWCGSFNTERQSYEFGFDANGVYPGIPRDRYWGLPIRPVYVG